MYITNYIVIIDLEKLKPYPKKYKLVLIVRYREPIHYSKIFPIISNNMYAFVCFDGDEAIILGFSKASRLVLRIIYATMII